MMACGMVCHYSVTSSDVVVGVVLGVSTVLSYVVFSMYSYAVLSMVVPAD